MGNEEMEMGNEETEIGNGLVSLETKPKTLKTFA